MEKEKIQSLIRLALVNKGYAGEDLGELTYELMILVTWVYPDAIASNNIIPDDQIDMVLMLLPTVRKVMGTTMILSVIKKWVRNVALRGDPPVGALTYVLPNKGEY